MNNVPRLPENAMAVSLDVIGAYQNIPQEDGLDCLHEALEERPSKDIPSDFIKDLLEIKQTFNLFEFNEDLWIQLVGFTLGDSPCTCICQYLPCKKNR